MQHMGRATTLGGILMTLLNFVFPRRQSRHDAEIAYLSAAVSRYDLEMREREIERGKFANF